MKKQKAYCYLRTHRRVWGLAQKHLAALLGYQSRTAVSRIEAGKCVPSLEIAFACQVLFGVPPDAMFPHVYQDIEERAMARIYRSYEGLLQSSSIPALRKRELFEAALRRAVTKPKRFEGV